MVAQREEYYLLPGDLPEDIRQEMAMASLTGKRSSMQRLRGEKDIGYGLQPIAEAIPVWSVVARPDYAVFERLTAFIMEQEEGIKAEVLAYLREPDEGRLHSIVRALGIEGADLVPTVPLTLTELMLKALPATQEELYTLARKSHPSRKPEVAVRQNIRNLIRSNRAMWEGEHLCVVGSAKQTSKRSRKQGSLSKV